MNGGYVKYHCDDGNAEVVIEAESAEDAAQEYVDGGSWGEIDTTTWVVVRVWTVDEDGESNDDDERHTIAIDPAEPDCSGEHEHSWRSPYSVLGGLKENPGVHGHGGGVIYTGVCEHCGAYRKTDTWAQNPVSGEQGLTSVSYTDADEASEAYVLRRARGRVARIVVEYNPVNWPALHTDGAEDDIRDALPESYDGDIDIVLTPTTTSLRISATDEDGVRVTEVGDEIEEICRDVE